MTEIEQATLFAFSNQRDEIADSDLDDERRPGVRISPPWPTVTGSAVFPGVTGSFKSPPVPSGESSNGWGYRTA